MRSREYYVTIGKGSRRKIQKMGKSMWDTRRLQGKKRNKKGRKKKEKKIILTD